MNKWLEIIIGLILVIVPIVFAIQNPFGWNVWPAALEMLKGGIFWIILIIGLLFILLGISDLKGK